MNNRFKPGLTNDKNGSSGNTFIFTLQAQRKMG